ncbi:MAG: RecQ family ATP-dependent DNA helicase [Evtepia gabavorous]
MHKPIYVALERLLQEGFLALMQEQKIAQVAVDEAHCISQWGQDFRPSYRKITEFVARLPRRPVLSAFTATATAEVQADILTQLELRDPVKVVTGFDRPNLYFAAAAQAEAAGPHRPGEARRDRSGIVHCATRSGVEKICDLLCQRGIPATRYHAGLSEEERQRNQDDFQFDRKTVMVATNAFGMGIDKSNVSFVIHYNMPKSLEAYYQEAGRAGRDGEAAECILLYGPGDVATAQFFLQQAGENEDLLPRGTGGGSGAGRPAPGGHGELLQDHPPASEGTFWTILARPTIPPAATVETAGANLSRWTSPGRRR